MTDSKKLNRPTYRQCPACAMIRQGVKISRLMKHTCGKSPKAYMKPYSGTKEENKQST